MGTDGSLAVDRDGVQHAQFRRLSKETLQRQMLNTSAGLGPSHVPGADRPSGATHSGDKLRFGLAHRLLFRRLPVGHEWPGGNRRAFLGFRR